MRTTETEQGPMVVAEITQSKLDNELGTPMANQFILDLKKASRRGTESKIEKGWFPHRAPEGYLNNLRDHTIEVDPERFLVLLRAWWLLLAGKHTLPQVIHTMNEEWGYRTRSTSREGGKKLNHSAGSRIFSNRFYTGYFLHRGVLYKGKHHPMVTIEEFQRVQKHIR